MCRAAGLSATLEVAITGQERPADLLIPHWRGGGPLAVDVSVVHSLVPSTSVSTVKTGEEAIRRKQQAKLTNNATA